jgi:hypothetical protein
MASYSRSVATFLGDAFVYFRRGRDPAGIFDRIKDGLLQASAVASKRREPLILVTHSFGTLVAFEALHEATDVIPKVDLWVSAGAQTSLFAEMGMFSLPTDDGLAPVPRCVRRWLNFFDAADVLSYLHEPVFGREAVRDIQTRWGQNPAAAHGSYFLQHDFYTQIGREVSGLQRVVEPHESLA